MNEEKIVQGRYDVFLCYNRKDQGRVKEIGEQLKEREIVTWDQDDIRPGRLKQREIEQQIAHIQAAAVFFGKAGISFQQQLEIGALLNRLMKRDHPVIPVR